MAVGDRRARRERAKVQIDGYGVVVLDSLDDLPQVKANLDKKFEEVRGFINTFWGGLSKEDKAAIATSPIPILGDAAGLYADAVNYINDPDSRNWLNYTLSAASVLPLVPSATQLRAAKQAKKALNVWHGSPHRFDRFSLEKIGTGEGAQAYGHGLYFAESPQVAKEYQKQASSWQLHRGDGSLFDPYEELQNRNVRAVLQATNGDIDEAIKKARSLQESIPGTQGAELALADIDILEKLKSGGGVSRPTGNLYNVDLDVDPDTLLDWDAPVEYESSFGQRLRDAAESEGLDLNDLADITGAPDGAYAGQPEDGASLYRWLEGSLGGPDKANKFLLENLDMPGIRYLDGMSRDAAEGTRNYVIFDDSLVTIKSVE